MSIVAARLCRSDDDDDDDDDDVIARLNRAASLRSIVAINDVDDTAVLRSGTDITTIIVAIIISINQSINQSFIHSFIQSFIHSIKLTQTTD